MTIGKWHLGVLTLLVALIGSDGGRPGLHTAVSLAAEAEVSSDVDRYISGVQAVRPNPQRWAVIIGIEKYQRTVGALFARRDAQSFKEYAQKLLEVPQENIFLLLDEEATKTTLQVLLEERLSRRLKAGDQVFVYYAGHGLADPRTGQPYLLPSDADPQSIQLSGYSAEAFYGALGRLKDQRVIVFLDACFSGVVGRQQQIQPLLLAARPLVLTVDDPALKHNNVTVLAAAQHDQLSNSDPENGHGLFTYQLLRGLVGEGDLNGDGRVRLVELASYVKEAVDRKARQLYGQTRDQTPVLTPAKLDTGQDIELTRRTGKMPPAEKPAVATKPPARAEVPPPEPPPRSKPVRDLGNFRFEVESLRVSYNTNEVIIFLNITNRSSRELAIALGENPYSSVLVIDERGARFSYGASSGIHKWMGTLFQPSIPDWLIIPPFESSTASITFTGYTRKDSPHTTFTFSAEIAVSTPDDVRKGTPLRTSILNVSIHGIRAQ